MAADGVVSELAHVSVHVGEIESGPHVGESVHDEKSPDTSFPMEAVDEWPESKTSHWLKMTTEGSVGEEDEMLLLSNDLATEEPET
ncbi:hypothetical protein E3N88_19683 [Mikania micrantha]|uniref:Uncharacterized protein n=1 Tax=Mikania micrantha TaxID=192012 RepID=A0A5N6NS12_9ASTR|nr:hypothetical protein E3N88_19683 [Mikania micrantha]